MLESLQNYHWYWEQLEKTLDKWESNEDLYDE